MVGQCDTLRDRYEDLERRKRSEAEGYQNDVRLLQQKMRRIETQLARAAISKAKGKIKVTERVEFGICGHIIIAVIRMRGK